VAVALAAFLEGVEVGRVGLRPIGLPLLSIARDAITFDIAQMR
jgi:hypothetical protein